MQPNPNQHPLTTNLDIGTVLLSYELDYNGFSVRVWRTSLSPLLSCHDINIIAMICSNYVEWQVHRKDRIS